MLVKFKRYVMMHTEAFEEGYRQMVERPLTSIMTIIIIGIALLLPGIFWVFSDNIDNLTRD